MAVCLSCGAGLTQALWSDELAPGLPPCLMCCLEHARREGQDGWLT